MTTHPSSPVGYGGYTLHDYHAIVRRAHMERAQAMREFFTWLFARRKAVAQRPGRPVLPGPVRCG
jgi:hypothetical protein